MAKGHHTDRAYGLLALLLVVAGVLTAFYLLNRHDTAEEAKRGGRERAAFVQDSLQQAAVAREEQRKLWAKQKEEREKKRAEWERRREEREKARAALDTITVRLVPFDPNKTDSSGFVHLGLKPWMARSVCRYVEKGGRFRKAEDFRKVYGMTDSLWLVLEPYIVIAQDSVQQCRYVSRKRDTVLQVNLADTAELQMIRGIGGFTARQIVEYRERLGGYVSSEQIREVPYLRNADSIIPHLATDTLRTRMLAVNRRSTGVLARHPYLTFEQAKAISEYRHRRGAIRSAEQLLKLKQDKETVFTEEDIKKIMPYLSFEE